MYCPAVLKTAVVVLTMLCMSACSHAPAAQSSPVDLDQVTFLSAWTQTGTVQLTGGEYREPAAPDSAAELVIQTTGKIAYGRLNGKPAAAVVLVTNAGGSGTFFDLALLRMRSGMWINTDVAELGDRVQLHAVVIEDNAIQVELTAHGPEDPMCCPTLRQKRFFTVTDERLVPAGVSAQPAAGADIVGTLWKWQQSRYSNDTESAPADPGRYTVQLQPDGSISVGADCNRAGGVYRLKGQQITIEITHSTMAACPPDSLEQAFLKDLNAAAIYFIKDGAMYLDLKYDSGTMEFLP